MKGSHFSVEMSPELKPHYADWMDRHARNRKGDAKARLKRHGHAERVFLERVWWPAFGTLEGLHPEFEVRDFKDGERYLDFAYIAQGLRLCVEIDGYGPHWRDIDRWKFGDHLIRQNHLIIDGWTVLRFSYDHLTEKPRICQQILQQALGRKSLISDPVGGMSLVEQAIVRLAQKQIAPIRTNRIAAELNIDRHTALRHLRKLVERRILKPSHPESKHARGYVLISQRDHFI